MKNILATSCLALSIFLALPALSGHHENKGDGDSPMMKNAATAKNWIKAQYTSKDKALKMVKKHMAEDGISFPGRFIGLALPTIRTLTTGQWTRSLKTVLQPRS